MLLWDVAVELPALVVDDEMMVELAFVEMVGTRVVMDEAMVAELAFVEVVLSPVVVET